jgi:gamma-glutamylcyclotransferase
VFYAAYGSNLHPLRLAERVPSARLVATAPFDGWRLVFHKRSNLDGSGKCNIVPADDRVWFTIYEIAADEKPLLDRIEGLHNGYVDTQFDVPGHGTCFAYVATESHIDDRLSPYAWYKALVIAGIEYHGFPRDYLRRVHAVSHRDDPDAERHALNMSLVDRARRSGAD